MRNLDYIKVSSDVERWIRDCVNSAGVDGIVLGLSGGVDSSVAAALSVNAIGKERVIGLNLPCESISQDINDAKLMAEQLNINIIKLDLTSIYKEFLRVVKPKIEPTKMSLANLKPRLRMMTSYLIGQSKGKYLVEGTGNRIELAVGYFTKYGDGGVDFEPLGGLYKCEVRKIARILKIPERIIVKPSSAGLWKGQTSEGEIGLSFDVLDEIVYRIDHNLSFDSLKKDDVEKVKKMMNSAQHKIKMPPIFKVNQ